MKLLAFIIVLMFIYDIVRLTVKLKRTDTYYAVVITMNDSKTKVYLYKTKFFAESRAKAYRKTLSALGVKATVVNTDTYGNCNDEGTLK